MTTRTKATRREAEAVLTALKRSYGWTPATDADWHDAYGDPELVENWDWGWTTVNTYRWAIVWEGGPYEWTYLFPGGGFDEEMYNLAFEFGKETARRLATKPGAELPDGVWTEAITSWAIAIYPKETA